MLCEFLWLSMNPENSHRAVKYVGSLLRETPKTAVTLFHVLKPMPRGLLEHGGSENPAPKLN